LILPFSFVLYLFSSGRRIIKTVKKLLAATLLLALCAFAQAQRYGVPPCATCITPNNPTPGIPGSATSFTAFNPPPSTSFTAFNPPPSMGFTAFNPPPSYGVGSASFRSQSGVSVSVGVNLGYGRGHGRHHYRGYGYGAPLVYTYPVYVPVESEAAPQPVADIPSGNALDREMWSRAAERDPNASNTNGNKDSRYGEHYLDSRETTRAGSSETPTIPPAPAPEDNGPSIILVLRDGSRLELGNYAIVGQTIFDLDQRAGRRGKKIQLAELDLPATQKANDALGLDFKLPTR